MTTKMYRVLWAIVILVLLIGLARIWRQEQERAVDVRWMDQSLVPEAPSEHRVRIIGRAIDDTTGAEIPDARVSVSVWDQEISQEAPFVLEVPAMLVVTITTTAPGYKAEVQQFKAHYQRDVTLTMDVYLEPVK